MNSDLKLEKTFKREGFEVPRFLYGTAWKEERTAELTREALISGFAGVDTANQRKHYYEVGVSRGVEEYLKLTGKFRNDLFLQSKYTYINGQDDRLPYNPEAPVNVQVRQSFKNTLDHFKTDYIDSFLIHGPLRWDQPQLSAEDFAVWEEFKTLKASGQTRFIGVSNFSAKQLKELADVSKVAPDFIQNRCFASSQWDRDVRKVCSEIGTVYQGFSLLTANIEDLRCDLIKHLCRKYKKTVPQIVFRFCLQKDMMILTGTSNIQHMIEDLDIFGFTLLKSEIADIENISLPGQN